MCSFGVLALVSFLGYRHIDLSAKVLGVALVLEIGVVVILDFVVVRHRGAAGMTLAHRSPRRQPLPGPRYRRVCSR